MHQNVIAAIHDEYLRRKNDLVFASIEAHIGRKRDYWKDRWRWRLEKDGENVIIYWQELKIGTVVVQIPDNPSSIEHYGIDFVKA
jgi:hypothetical protein